MGLRCVSTRRTLCLPIRYPRNDEEYAFVSLFKESHLSDKNLSLGAAHDDYDGRYRKVAAIAWLLAREGRSALRSFES